MVAEPKGAEVNAGVGAAAVVLPNENADGCVAVFAAPKSDVVVAGLEVAVELPNGEAVLKEDAAPLPNNEDVELGTFSALPNVGAEIAPVDALPKSEGVVVVDAGMAPNNELDVVAVEAELPNNGADVGVAVCVEPNGEEVFVAPPNKGAVLVC